MSKTAGPQRLTERLTASALTTPDSGLAPIESRLLSVACGLWQQATVATCIRHKSELATAPDALLVEACKLSLKMAGAIDDDLRALREAIEEVGK